MSQKSLAGKHSIDMCNGAILPKLVKFIIPVFFMNILQLFYNAADIVVVGQFAGKEAVGAVGATGALINLIVNLFIGLGVGVNVVAGQYIGAGRQKEVPDVIKTATIIAVLGGIGIFIIGFFFSEDLLKLMLTPDDVLPLATKYLSIYFIGAPAALTYNFLSAILRADGDTKRPLVFLVISGFANVVLNLFFVAVLGMDVDGVAWATVASQYVSAALVIVTLMKEKGYLKLEFNNFKIYPEKIKSILSIGIPSGVYGSLFSIANVLIQSAVNSFDSAVIVSGVAAASNLEGFVWMGMNSVSVAATSFASQNMGAMKFGRIRKTLWLSYGTVIVIWAVLSGGMLLTRELLFSFYLPGEPEAVAYGISRIVLLLSTYFLGGMMDVTTSLLRGMGYSSLTTIISLIGSCGLRALWIFFIFYPSKAIYSISESIQILYAIFPISWSATIIGLLTCYFIVMRKLKKQHPEANMSLSQ
ncbi:MAG: MATE family efflux transporter [Clostridia bacterium]|nr:MATE family efflux transporter [Clostridia bacterium]